MVTQPQPSLTCPAAHASRQPRRARAMRRPGHGGSTYTLPPHPPTPHVVREGTGHLFLLVPLVGIRLGQQAGSSPPRCPW